MPVVETGSWQGILGTSGTPPAMVSRLNAEMGKILETPEITAKIAELAATSGPGRRRVRRVVDRGHHAVGRHQW